MNYKDYELEVQTKTDGSNIHLVCNYLHQISLVLRLLYDIEQETDPDPEDIKFAEISKKHVYIAVRRIFEMTGVKFPRSLRYGNYTLDIPQPD